MFCVPTTLVFYCPSPCSFFTSSALLRSPSTSLKSGNFVGRNLSLLPGCSCSDSLLSSPRELQKRDLLRLMLQTLPWAVVLCHSKLLICWLLHFSSLVWTNSSALRWNSFQTHLSHMEKWARICHRVEGGIAAPATAVGCWNCCLAWDVYLRASSICHNSFCDTTKCESPV